MYLRLSGMTAFEAFWNDSFMRVFPMIGASLTHAVMQGVVWQQAQHLLFDIGLASSLPARLSVVLMWLPADFDGGLHQSCYLQIPTDVLPE